jgi:thymidylate synthase
MNEKLLYTKIYRDLHVRGKERSPRGMLTKELENYHIDFLPYHKFINFESRKLNINYIKKEIQWYFKGSLEDLSICNEAAIWKKCVTNGKLHSNYGYYLFTKAGLGFVVNELTRDKDSRRALVSIFNSHQHLFSDNNDVPCTATLGFRIRDGALNMTVHMRSQDAIYGLGNDLPFFNLCWEIVAIALNIPQGRYHHFVESFHVYEKHFNMLNTILHENTFYEIKRPKIDLSDAQQLLNGLYPSHGSEFIKWLHDET